MHSRTREDDNCREFLSQAPASGSQKRPLVPARQAVAGARRGTPARGAKGERAGGARRGAGRAAAGGAGRGRRGEGAAARGRGGARGEGRGAAAGGKVASHTMRQAAGAVFVTFVYCGRHR